MNSDAVPNDPPKDSAPAEPPPQAALRAVHTPNFPELFAGWEHPCWSRPIRPANW